jgi:hypothetical protein
MGWPAFSEEFMKNRVLDDAPPDFFPPRRKPADVRGKCAGDGCRSHRIEAVSYVYLMFDRYLTRRFKILTP